MQKILKKSGWGRAVACVVLHPKIVDDLRWIKRQPHRPVAVQRGNAGGAVVERFFYRPGRSAATALSVADGVAQSEKAGSIGKRGCLVKICKLLLAAVVFDNRIGHSRFLC